MPLWRRTRIGRRLATRNVEPVPGRGSNAGGSAAGRAHARRQATERLPFFGIAVRVYERDKHAAGTLLGSALALRLFLLFVPTVLLLFGVAGILGGSSVVDSSSDIGIGGALGHEIDSALDQDRL